MKITFCGAAGSVTGSSYLLETEQGNILVDCGMFQGAKNLLKRNYLDFPYDPKSITAVLITHAHIDHSGLLPKLVKNGFKGSIYTARPTNDILQILLYDSAHIEESGIKYANRIRKRQGRPLKEPMFKKEDVTETLQMIEEMEYHNSFKPIDNITATFFEAGHIMGSSYLELQIVENGITKKFIFSGDIGRSFQAFIKDPEVSESADVLFIESTYGNRLHKKSSDTKKEITAVLDKVVKTNGTLLIPSFAVGRTQEMIYQFFELFDKHKIPPVNIYIDSPMGDKVTQIYGENKDLYDSKTVEYLRQGKDPLDLKLLHFIKSSRESKELNKMPGPKIIISASGMCHGGRIMHHLKHNIWKDNCYILFVGYQGKGTLGRKIIEGAEFVKILGEKIAVQATVHTIGGLSAHADRDDLLSWLNFYRKSSPLTFTVHGEPDVCAEFSKTIADKFGYKTIVPDWLDNVDFTFTPDSVDYRITSHETNVDYNNEKNKLVQNFNTLTQYFDEIEKTGADTHKKENARIFLEKLNRIITDNFDDFKSGK